MQPVGHGLDSTALSSSKLGCYVGRMYVGCIIYADNIILLLASLNMLQRMLKICETEAHYLDMKFNAAKSVILRVGYSYVVDCAKLAIDGCELQFVCELKYLGVHLLCGKKLRLSLYEYKAKFFNACLSYFDFTLPSELLHKRYEKYLLKRVCCKLLLSMCITVSIMFCVRV